ncbi:MAG TPA: sigma-54 dependent transcriptional regulator [Planctomycetaceae bacterium]|nr:sigma-54 dependent transcriptional regulator [Planctomycetaceae bacterium]
MRNRTHRAAPHNAPIGKESYWVNVSNGGKTLSEPAKIELLIADDDADFRGTAARHFRRRGFHVQEAAGGDEALERLNKQSFDVALLDMMMPGLSGMDVLDRITTESRDVEVILLTAQGTIDSAVKAMKLGASDYLTKPFPLSELEILIEKACERSRLKKENRQLKAVLQRSQSDPEIIGQSPAMRAVFRLIEKAAPSDRPILIQGESGTGKELVARALHRRSPRAERPLVVVNCAALPEQLLESELFGHEKGSFTGAGAAKAGLIEIADEATLFIDEIGEMPAAMQAKLLRVLEDGSMRRVGSLRERRVNVRVITATNRNLADEVRANRFREDLYYRINTMTIDLPPLRERHGDIRLFIDRFLGPGWEISPDAAEKLERYRWPGNVRQLINVIERAKILADDQSIVASDLPPELNAPATASPLSEAGEGPLSDDLESLQKSKIVEVLDRVGGNKTRAARLLGITRRSLYRLLERYELGNDSSDRQTT